MFYTKFTLSNYRCFLNEQELKFARPVEGKLGSGITYLVGANNSGKTTIIEGLWMKKDCTLNDSEKKTYSPEFRWYDDNGIVKTVKLLREHASRFVEDPPNRKSDDDLFEIISSRRHWESNAQGSMESNSFVSSTALGNSPRKQPDLRTALFLKAIEENDRKYKEFTSLVQEVIPEFNSWAVGHEGDSYIKYISMDGSSHKTDFLGDGVISIIRILAHLFEERASGLIIDEPELSLHPLTQKRLSKLIARYAQKRQIIISTHSPYFLSWEFLKNGAALNRIMKSGQEASKIYTLGKYEKYKNLIKGGNWQQPHLMDITAKEIFFHENILFVEGQEDVGLLQGLEAFSDGKINFFGYGVRGYGNFEFALELAKDIGIKKACILIDASSDPAQDKNENATKSKLEKKFGEFYKIIQWNKTDIRDKFQQMIPAKEGYFTEEGKLKEKNMLDDFDEKIAQLVDYFK